MHVQDVFNSAVAALRDNVQTNEELRSIADEIGELNGLARKFVEGGLASTGIDMVKVKAWVTALREPMPLDEAAPC